MRGRGWILAVAAATALVAGCGSDEADGTDLGEVADPGPADVAAEVAAELPAGDGVVADLPAGDEAAPDPGVPDATAPDVAPADAAPEAWPEALGIPCEAAADCQAPLACVTLNPKHLPGVCSFSCTLRATDACPDGFECVPVTALENEGFCLAACDTERPCSGPLTCGVCDGIEPWPDTCFAW